MQALKNIYEMIAQNLKIARIKITDNINPIPTKLKEGDLVLIKDHTAKAFPTSLCRQLQDCLI